MGGLDLYMHSFDVTYNTIPNEGYYFLPVVFPEAVTVPANSVVNIDMKLRVNMFSTTSMRYAAAVTVVPNKELLNTPLIYTLSGMPVNDGEYASDLFIAVRNMSNTDYDIPAHSSLFSIMHGGCLMFEIHQVSDEHMTMELRPVE